MPIKYKAREWGLKPNGTIHHHKKKYDELSKEAFKRLVRDNQLKYFSEDFDINNHSQNLFELAYNTYDGEASQNMYAKFWLDIDMINTTTEELYDLLTDLFNKIDGILSKELNRETYLVYYKKIPNSNKIHSLRIINSDYSVEMNQMLNIAKTIAEDKTNQLCSNTDTAVYAKNRQICLPYNSKIYTDKYEKYPTLFNGLKNTTSSSHIFVDYNYNNTDNTKIQVKTVTKSLISYTGNIKQQLVYTNDILEAEKQDITQEIKHVDYHSNRTHIILDKDALVQTAIKYMPKSFYEKRNGKWWIHFVKILKSVTHILKKDLHDFLEHSIKMTDGIDYDLEKNVEFCNRLQFNTKDKQYLIRNYGKNAYVYICNYLNKNQDKYWFYVNNLFGKINSISSWISEVSNIEYNNVYNALYEIKDLTNDQLKSQFGYMISITDKVIYNVKTGYLYDDKLLPTLRNYNTEKEYYPRYEQSKNKNLDKYDLVTDRLTDGDNKLIKSVNDIIDKFIAGGEFKTLVAEMSWATGKSIHVCKKILQNSFDSNYNRDLQQYINDKNTDYSIFYNADVETEVNDLTYKVKRNLIVSPNNALNRKETQELMAMNGSCFTTHLAIQDIKAEMSKNYNRNIQCKLNFFTRHLNMISSVESIDAFSIYDYDNLTKQKVINTDCVDTVILDEFNTILNNFDIEAKTFRGIKKKYINEPTSDEYIQKMEYSLNYLIDICKIAKRVLILDADINFTKLDWFLSKINATDDTYKVKINYNKFVNENYKIYIYESQDAIVSKMTEKKDNIQELVCVSNNKAQDLFISLINESFDDECNLLDTHKNECYGLINGNGLCVFDCRNLSKSLLTKKLFVTEEVVISCYNDTQKVHRAKHEIAKNQQEQRFHQIVIKHSLKFIEQDIDTTDNTIENLKIDFLNNYEECICRRYKFTKYIRTPTIKCGISLNPFYFDELYFFVYFGVLTIEEYLQMMWRSRNLNNGELHITFNQNFTEWNDYYGLSFIQDKLINKAKCGSKESKYLTDIDNKIYQMHGTPINELIILNELDKCNSTHRPNQLFMEKLFYHGFRLNKDIFFVAKADSHGEKYFNEAKMDRLAIQKQNFLNIDIADLTPQIITTIKEGLQQNNSNVADKISDVYRNRYSKYKKLHEYLEFDKVLLMMFNKNLTADECDYMYDLNDKIDDPPNELSDEEMRQLRENKTKLIDLRSIKSGEKRSYLDQLHDCLIRDYDTRINTEQMCEEYGFHNTHSSCITKVFQIKAILNADNALQKSNDKKINLDTATEIKLKRTKLLTTLLAYLDIDLLRDFNKNNVKRFIAKNDKEKFNVTGFINSVLSTTNVLDVNGTSMNFLEWLQMVVIATDYNHQDDVYKINFKKNETLNAVTHFVIIKKVVNYYLKDILMYFDYENQQTNSAKLLNKLQFVIKKEFNIKITNEPTIDQYRFNNPPIINQSFCHNNKISITETYLNNVDKIITVNKPTDIRPPIVIYKHNIDTEYVINNNIILRPTSKISRKPDYCYYYNNNTKIDFTVKTKIHPRVIRMNSDYIKNKADRIFKDYIPNTAKINGITNFIDRQTQIKDQKFIPTKFYKYLTDMRLLDIVFYDTYEDCEFSKVDRPIELRSNQDSNGMVRVLPPQLNLYNINELNITKVKRAIYIREYKKLMDINNDASLLYQAFRKSIVMKNINTNHNIDVPIITTDRMKYKQNCVDKLYFMKHNPNVVKVVC